MLPRCYWYHRFNWESGKSLASIGGNCSTSAFGARRKPSNVQRPLDLVIARAMGSTEVAVKMQPQDQEVLQPRRRFKTSELPLSATQRSDIDGLLHTLKKKGHYDTVRKNVWSQFVESVSSLASFATMRPTQF